ncbi:MAG TPA: flagellar basal body-associated FliL family protein [Cellvibrio sp.]|nr:flagellar basal body-associated FliL family protein [Cellvibrio sp.]
MSISYLRNIKQLTTAGALTLLAPIVLASGGGGEKFVEGVNYLPIKPALVVNYGGAGKVKYIKAEISLRVEDAHSASEVSHHMPLIRDTLIMLLSSMTDEEMGSGDGKESMRQEALLRINEAIEAQAEGHHESGGGKSRHSKTETAKDNHAKDDHGDADKDEHGKAEKPKDEHAKAEPRKKAERRSSKAAQGPVSDLLFDNLVVQK